MASLPPRSRPFFRHAAAVGGLFAGLSDAGFGAAPLCRGVVCAHQVGASTSTALTVRLERGWCPLCALSALARDFRPWQAVAAVGVEVHLWRVEVRLRRQLLVHIQPRPASLRAAPHRLCPCRMSSPAAALLAAAHPSHCPAFDVLLYRPARPTTVTTVAGTEVAGVSSALCDSIMAEFVLLSLRSLLPLVLPAAARRCGAAWRRPRHTWRRGAAAAIIRRLGRAARTSPATFP